MGGENSGAWGMPGADENPQLRIMLYNELAVSFCHG